MKFSITSEGPPLKLWNTFFYLFYICMGQQGVLVLLISSYLVGEMGHFMLGATSRDMARDIGFGDEDTSSC